eukprot:GHVP01059374.1.p1 GENE.GHVP01059374.1~~GHVP01059374.1.p1  ORF type:complete len:540 (+),score=88.49 GHVP01059374.1:29-1621(+)
MVDIPKILILDFGSQYTHIICRRFRQLGIFSEVFDGSEDHNLSIFNSVSGVVLSGGPSGVYEEGAPHVSSAMWQHILENKIPMLGICYGFQEIVSRMGGEVAKGTVREYGLCVVNLEACAKDDPIMEGFGFEKTNVWMSHGDHVSRLPDSFELLASSENHVAAARNLERKIWAFQFHPEVSHTEEGMKILTNFVTNICKLDRKIWTMEHFAVAEIKKIHEILGPDTHVIGAISGGVDSTVGAALLKKAIGPRFHPIFVDTGYLRKDERIEVVERLNHEIPNMNLQVVDASENFFNEVSDITDPELKRKTIGRLFIETFEKEGKKIFGNTIPLEKVFLLQGTLYPDVIESVSYKGPSVKIKTHHNVGGLPKTMKLKVIEPLRELFKDEVRELGRVLGLSDFSVGRHPFPGPGLAIRILGKPTRENVRILQAADAILINELRTTEYYDKISQAFVAIFPDAKTVGVMGDNRTYEMMAVIRCVTTDDFMTADYSELPNWLVKRISSKITNEVSGINRVCYDVSSKPPATIEFE